MQGALAQTNPLTGLISGATAQINQALNPILTSLSPLLNVVSGLITGIQNAFSLTLSQLISAFTSLLGPIFNALTYLTNLVANILFAAICLIGTFAQVVAGITTGKNLYCSLMTLCE